MIQEKKTNNSNAKNVGQDNVTGVGYPGKNFFLSIVISVALILLSLIEGDPAITNGLIFGSLAGMIFFAVAWWTVSVIVKEKSKKSPNPIMAVLAIKVFILKFPVLGIGLWFAFKYFAINPFALVGGIAVTQIAILIAALHKLITKQE
ncbi:MAG: hypothetical protein GY868_00920 [Deltaproteobacteria bacterium]|nr:hypothetical protein [Deltaproteobacteria bacterium]